MNPIRITHNFLQAVSGGNYSENDINTLVKFHDYIKKQKELPTFKVALLFICINQPYWEYAKDVIEGAKKYFLPGHKVDHFLWSDMPEETHYGAKVYPTEGVEWPAGTLYRYHLFLQAEQDLKDYDYIFYCDIDMRFMNYIGDEILGDGLTAALHPMYALKKQLWPPYEPNKDSTAYIKRPGKVIDDGGSPRFMPMYFAGGFQGGKRDNFIKAWKVISKNIDEDENKLNYRAVWNDETHWNKYLTDNEPSIVLSPSYIYPDSLIKEYYEPIWGVSYPPKLMTLTKKFSTKPLSPEELTELNKMQQLK